MKVLRQQPRKGRKRLLHNTVRGFFICTSCWRTLSAAGNATDGGRRRNARRIGEDRDPFGHDGACANRGQSPQPIALIAAREAEILRLLACVPSEIDHGALQTWGHSLGYALRLGIVRQFVLSDSDIDFLFEGAWMMTAGGGGSSAWHHWRS